MEDGAALLIVDVQNDFCPGGALGVSGGDEIIPLINRYIDLFKERGAAIIASRDWHPPVTRHFKEFGGIWPAHCVAESFGAMFHANLRLFARRAERVQESALNSEFCHTHRASWCKQVCSIRRAWRLRNALVPLSCQRS